MGLAFIVPVSAFIIQKRGKGRERKEKEQGRDCSRA